MFTSLRDFIPATKITGAYAGGRGAHAGEGGGRLEKSKRGEKVPPRYVGKKECARSAQIRQN